MLKPLSPQDTTIERLGEEWRRCRGWLLPALEHGGNTHGIVDVFDMVVDGRAQLWPGRASAAITQLIDYPRLRSCRVWLAGGELRELADELRPAIKQWARELGCSRVELSGRRWHRVLGEGREVFGLMVDLI